MIRNLALTAVLLLLAGGANAFGENQAHKSMVAQMAFLAQLAPNVCSDFKTDDEAVAVYIAGSQLK